MKSFAIAPIGAAVLLSFASAAHAGEVGSGTLSTTSPSLSFTAGPFTLTNNSYQLPTGSTCSPDAIFRCDTYALTVDVPVDYATSHPRDRIHFAMTWPDHSEDIDLYVFDADGNEVSNGQAASTADPELADLAVAPGTYTVQIYPYDVHGGGPTTVSIDLITLPTPVDAPVPPEAAGLLPQYAVHPSPQGLGDDSGEPSVGYNPATGHAMLLAGLQTLRITFPEKLAQPMPEVCDAQWEDVSGLYTEITSLDPILFTDQSTGRTFVSQLNASLPFVISSPADTGSNSLFGYSDDDGDSWLPGQIALPDSGYDHQTVGAGPFHEPAPSLASFPSAVYYCSQAGNPAFCSRSDDGGLTFGPSVQIFQGGVGERCSGIHGHVRVANDGTVYVPARSCDHHQGITLSEDNGQTWHSQIVPDSTEGLSDPELALASDGSGYFCYADEDGHLKVAVTRDKGATWSQSQDVGLLAGVKNAVFPEVIAGDPDRASCAFIGTSEPGDREAGDFPGIWYPYLATTYDGGQTWQVVNLSPNDPVQREGGICLSGIACSGGNRNLLDFNEITLDENGRVIFGYADGCIDDCVQAAPNTFSAKAVVARQIGGRPLFAMHDPSPSATPGAACLAGSSDGKVAQLNWRAPGAGGSEIERYRVYRSENGGSPELAGETSGPQLKLADAHSPLGTHHYTYTVKAVNANGEGAASNPIALDVTGDGTSVTPPPVTTPATTSDSRFGGALPLAALVVLGLAGLARRRKH
ncbi:MAG TPA: hypothetical protein VFB36_05910 [Nevskiaceae bacterium]|nr:hypothetical protein [Nevskiaceae bacterium]